MSRALSISIGHPKPGLGLGGSGSLCEFAEADFLERTRNQNSVHDNEESPSSTSEMWHELMVTAYEKKPKLALK